MPNHQRNNKGQFKKNNKFNKKSLESQESEAESNYKLLIGLYSRQVQQVIYTVIE